jgi:N6-adenosine-specific RNA methylase IME4
MFSESILEGAPYKTIVCDPPWHTPGGSKFMHGTDGKAYVHNKAAFDSMTIEEILGMQVGELADKDAHLYLWTVFPFYDRTFEVCRSWGFKPSSPLIWVKKGLGLGWNYRMCHEMCVLAVRGSLRTRKRNIRSVFEGKKGVLAQKPEEFFRMVEQQSPGPYLELFSRQQRKGWTCWGNAIPASMGPY